MAALTEITASSYEFREKKPADAVTDNNPLLYMLKQKGMVKVINGGREIWEDIRYAQNAYVQRIDPSEEITLGYNQTLTGFQYSPKIIVVPTVINALERAQNEGEAQFLDLLETRMNTAEDSLMNSMEEDLQGDGTGYGGKAFAGVQAYISTTPTAGEYGGLSRLSYPSIQNYALDAATTFGTATDASNIEQRLRFAKNKVIRNREQPELLLMGETYFNAVCDAMSAKQRFVKNEKLAEAGFDNVMVEGMTAVLANGKSFSGLSRIGAKRAYGINLSTLSLKMYRNYNFQPVQERVSVNQLVDVSIMVGIGQLTSSGTGLDFVMFEA